MLASCSVFNALMKIEYHVPLSSLFISLQRILYRIALEQVTEWVEMPSPPPKHKRIQVEIDFLDWWFYTFWQTPLLRGNFHPNQGCHWWLVGKPERCFWFVKITGLSIGWSDFGKVDQSGEALFLIISNDPLLKFGLLSSVGSIFYFG